MTSASLRIDVGVRIGPYLVERRLSRSRAGSLYVARDPGGALAVLRLVQADAATGATRARLRREARALAGVDHPGVVRVLGIGEQEGVLWIATNYVRGTDLQRLLDERGPMSVDVALRHAIQAGEALVAAHDAGAVHRDLKPSNMVLTLDERIVVVDFGLGPSSEGGDDVTTGVRNQLAGITAYSAPEQIEHGLADERSDVWSLGSVLYEMVVGAPPFGKVGPGTAAAILRDEPYFPAMVPPPIVHTVNACLRKNSFARVATSRELLLLLRDALEDVHLQPAPAGERISSNPAALQAFPVSGIIPPPPRLPSVWMSASRPPEAAPARPPSSRTRVTARGRVKGAAVRAGIAWFAEAYGQSALARVVDLASPELRAILRPKDPVFGLIASGWYETQRIGELIELIERVASPVDPANFGSAVGEAIAHDNVGGVHRALFRLVATPSMLEANAQRVWRTYVDEGSFSVRMRGRGSFDAKARGWSRHHPSVCRIIRGMLESSLRSVGYTSLVLARTQCVGLGDPHCLFTGKWAV